MKSIARTLVLIAASAFMAFLVVAGPAAGSQRAATGVRVTTIRIVMRDPGCHWFSAGGKLTAKLTAKGPVAVVNYDEAAVKVVGPRGARHVAVGKSTTLSRGTYRITMLGQAPDDNTLRLVVL